MLMIFPFIPIQITMVDQIIEGFPPFILTFERDQSPIEKDFLKKSMLAALPSALMVVFSIIFVRIFGTQNGWTQKDISTISYYLLGAIGFFSVVRACRPFNWMRIALLVETVAMFVATAILFRPLLEIGLLTSKTFPVFACLVIVFAVIFVFTSKLSNPKKCDKIKA
jgi:cation-transporting ATPase E